MIDLEHLRQILELARANDVRDLEIESEGLRLRIRVDPPSGKTDRQGGSTPAPPPVVQASAAGAPITAPALVPPPGPLPVPAEAPPPVVDAADLVIVTSPIVGTFYRSPEPGARPFVEPGQRVRRGQVLCIIEAMKLMNEIESEHAGEIVSVFVENDQAVQYGENLFAIRTA